MRILVIDDDASHRSLLSTALRQAGVAVTCAEDGDDALAKFADARPDVILSDTQMPNMDGLRLTRALRAAGVPTPIVLMSSVGGEAMERAAIGAGATAFAAKPVDVERIIAGLPRLMRELTRAA